MGPADTLLFGALSRDIYLGRDLILPGGGVLNMAWAWSRIGLPFRLLTRIGDDDPDLFRDFLVRHGIAHLPASIVGSGPSASIDIVIRPDRQPHMDHFVGGVWDDLALTDEERAAIADARRLHVVLVEGAIEATERLGDDGALAGVEVSADFLAFRHYTVERFARTMRHVDIGFVGWPGERDDPVVDGLRAVAQAGRKLVVVTLGARGVLVFDGRDGRDGPGERFVPVTPRVVLGTTVGCGDAFIAAFLAAHWRGSDLDTAVEAGKAAGADATAWRRPVPDEAYGPTMAERLRLTDEEAEEDDDDTGDGDRGADARLPT
jgi:fructoselysine 6-kinase